MDDQDKEVVVKEAEKLLKQSKLKRKLPMSKTNKVLPVERELMLKIYSAEVKPVLIYRHFSSNDLLKDTNSWLPIYKYCTLW